MQFYTGVGSRKTPPEILTLMTRFAMFAARNGLILRSGGAIGADQAFEAGAGDLKEIYRPEDATPEALELAAQYHPAWHYMKWYSRRLHGRNAFQVLGKGLNTPSKFLICWTPDGCTRHSTRKTSTGGTGTAISIASEVAKIPIFNMQTAGGLLAVETAIRIFERQFNI
ncbi:hypothetical protein Dvar_40930 [Desulfosarcina variabilis str. Montpellier]|uniref:hypothetical protein n=1 Tax=Desulfosarcina variabilis TaxID=2300 RepID=UPI003AFB073A